VLTHQNASTLRFEGASIGLELIVSSSRQGFGAELYMPEGGCELHESQVYPQWLEFVVAPVSGKQENISQPSYGKST